VRFSFFLISRCDLLEEAAVIRLALPCLDRRRNSQDILEIPKIQYQTTFFPSSAFDVAELRMVQSWYFLKSSLKDGN